MSDSKFFGNPILVCPVCGGRDRTIFVCARCWQDVPAKDRAMLRTMRNRNQPTETKVASVVAKLRAKRGL